LACQIFVFFRGARSDIKKTKNWPRNKQQAKSLRIIRLKEAIIMPHCVEPVSFAKVITELFEAAIPERAIVKEGEF